jgi:hypothetical protein
MILTSISSLQQTIGQYLEVLSHLCILVTWSTKSIVASTPIQFFRVMYRLHSHYSHIFISKIILLIETTACFMIVPCFSSRKPPPRNIFTTIPLENVNKMFVKVVIDFLSLSLLFDASVVLKTGISPAPYAGVEFSVRDVPIKSNSVH